MSKSIDIIIPTFARPGAAQHLAGSLQSLLHPHDRIIIVCQDSEETIRPSEDFLTYVHSLPPNLPTARNTGVNAGLGEIILFLDDDVKILDENLLAAHRLAHDDNAVGAVAGYVDDIFFVKNSEMCSTFDEKTGELIQNFGLSRQQETISVMGAHMSFKRKALEGIGGFDENYKKNALWEDVDCAFRLRKAGWKIMFHPDAKVSHIRQSVGGCRAVNPLGYTYHQFANTAYFCAKFASKRYYWSWICFWNYRLEYISREKWFRLNHNFFIIVAGLLGAAAGLLRYVTRKMHRGGL